MRSTSVSPSATRPAITRLAEARRSVAITVAPESFSTPSMTANFPSTWILAPRRTSSFTCMKRFSKMVSVTLDGPSPIALSDHELGLHVGRKARVFGGAEALRRQAALRTHVDAILDRGHRGAGRAQLFDHRIQVVGAAMPQHDVAAGRRNRAQESAGLDAVGHHLVGAAAEFFDALDA